MEIAPSDLSNIFTLDRLAKPLLHNTTNCNISWNFFLDRASPRNSMQQRLHILARNWILKIIDFKIQSVQ